MALQWRWEDKVGELEYECKVLDEVHKFKVNLYQGNALLIMVHEDGETYNLWSFWADYEHAKRMLGLSKGYKENTYNDAYHKVTKIRLNKAKCTDLSKIVTLIARAFDDITIEIYKEA